MPSKTIVWLAGAGLLGAAYVAATMVVGGDRRMLLIGKTTDAHHQIETVCETCHAAPPFADAAVARKALNGTCLDCHEAGLKAAGDSHSRKLFRGSRMAVFRDRLDARLCTNCHAEHRPGITRAGAVTVATDFCVACHSEGGQDVRKHRPSHADLAFDTCASAGCHNYHDNRALYEDFLVEHAGGAEHAPSPVHGPTVRLRTRELPPDKSLGRGEAVAPAAALAVPGVLDDWAGSGHAAAGVNCAACHAADADAMPDGTSVPWIDAPPMEVCGSCHELQTQSFSGGRHGMRGHPRIARPRASGPWLKWVGLADPVPPEHMTVGEARLPMRPEADPDRILDCGACHRPHDADIVRAAVEACASCHDDPHTRAYFGSPHHRLRQAELAGAAPPGAGVTCATCHMPGTGRGKALATDHNQNDTLRPNGKMIRPVCLDCHGLGFSLDALADAGLIGRNFNGAPAVHVESIDWAVRRAAGAGRDAGRPLPGNQSRQSQLPSIESSQEEEQ
ncbi:MAG: NrfA- nitrite reduction protein [Gammaproteobacteria bacterium]|nr:NrfA- nitrite reduction protein [Gammaproteobacteria bacterium]